MSARDNLQQLLHLKGPSLGLRDLFIRMAADQGPEEREQLDPPAHQGQCPLRRLLPEDHKLAQKRSTKKPH